jgi:hypothetical protein
MTWCKQIGKKHGNIIFVTLWMVWCARNDFIFNNQRENTHTSVAKIHLLVNAISADTFLLPEVTPIAVNHRRVKWTCPVEGFACPNVDESLLGSNNMARYDGLRNRDGDFIGDFYGVDAISNILFAEILVIWYGLKLSWQTWFS